MSNTAGTKRAETLSTQFLDRGLGTLGFFNQTDDSRQHGFGANRRYPDGQHAVAVDRAAGDAVAVALVDRQALAGDQRLIDRRFTIDDFAIDRNARPGLDPYAIAENDVDHRHFLFATVAQQYGGIRAQRLQGADGLRRLPLGPCFQPFAEAHQDDDDGSRFEIKMGVAMRQPEIERQAKCSAGTEADQQIHIAAARLDGTPRGPVETRPEPELDRQGECELPGGRQHPVGAEQGGQHRHDQRQDQQAADQHRQPFAPGIVGRGIEAVGKMPHGNRRRPRPSIRRSVGTLLPRWIRAVSLARLMLAVSTPGTAASAFSTRPAQEAQVMPPMARVISVVISISGNTR